MYEFKLLDAMKKDEKYYVQGHVTQEHRSCFFMAELNEQMNVVDIVSFFIIMRTFNLQGEQCKQFKDALQQFITNNTTRIALGDCE